MPDNSNYATPSSLMRDPNAWLILLGFLVLGIPTIGKLANESWSTESGAQGPIILFTSLWLFWRERKLIKTNPDGLGEILPAAIFIVSLALYIFGRAFDFLTAEAAGLVFAVISLVVAYTGISKLRITWFPLFYFALIIPPPAWLLTQLTGPLKQFVSSAAIVVLSPLGVPVTHEGVTIFVAQYQLLVEDACSGMNSLIGLCAIGLFYIYLTKKSSLLYSLLLLIFIVPIAISANIIRIIFLILLTYSFGDAVGQGFLHMAAGLFLFATALTLVFIVDRALSAALRKSWARQ